MSKKRRKRAKTIKGDWFSEFSGRRKTASIRGCTQWTLSHRTGFWDRECGKLVSSRVQNLGVKRFIWAVYVQGQGLWSGGVEATGLKARQEADKAIQRYGASH